MTMKKSLQLNGLVAAMMLAVGGAEAAGLGKMSIQSAMGQPLRAEIELLSVQPEEIGTVDARLASADAFRQARIQRTDTHGNLRFTIEQRPNGTPFLKVTSTAPVSDPFLDLLIELNWSSGRILREYTVLLDPPATPSPQVVAAPKTPAAKAAAPAKPTKGVQPEAAKPPSAGKEPAAPAPQKYGPIKSGETLRSIAAKVQHQDVTLEMMVASLYQANKQAFVNDNMNLLKQGQVLKVPERDAVMLMFSPNQAKQLMREHATAWNAYRGQVADTAAKAPAAAAPSPGTGKIAPAKPQEAGTAPAASKDVLKLSKGEPGKPQADAQAMQRIQTLEEELAAKSRALQEAQDRVAQLEKTVGDLQRLMNMQGQPAGETPPAAPVAAAPAAEPVQAPAKPKPAVASPVVPPQEESSWVSGLMQNPLYLGGIGAAVLLSGLLGYMVISSRRRKAMATLEQSVLSGGDQFKTAIFRTGTGKTVGAAATEGPVTELSRLGLGAIDTHEVDPIAEAEVYMAYGRDAQAEEILKAAMVKDPSRHEIHLKLLEIYAGREDKVAFETLATELYAASGGQPTEVWVKAAEMGRGLDPENPLYQIAGAAAPTPAPSPEPEPESEAASEGLPPVAEQARMAIPTAEPEPAAEDDHIIEFEMPIEAEAAARADIEIPAAIAEPVESEAPLDFEPMDIELEAPATKEGSLEFPRAEADLVAEDIQLEAPELSIPADEFDVGSLPEQVPAAAKEEAGMPEFEIPEFNLEAEAAAAEEIASPDLDFSGIDLELKDVPEVEEAAATQIDPELWEEVNTKMDLAKAYLEMGDREGAREILQEILNEGDDQQKAEASRLLADTE
jgi:pilus assembly protein FimV